MTSPLVPLTLTASPLASSIARFWSVTSRTCGQQQPFAAGPLALVLEAEDRLVGPLALDRHVADVEREGRGELELARAELDDLARLGLDQRRLGLLRGVGTGFDPRDFRGRLGDRGRR